MVVHPQPGPAEIQAQQLIRLRELLQVVETGNAFYRGKLGSAGLSLASLEELRRLPFTTKAELVADQQRHPPFGTNLTFPLEQFTRYHQTSGTTAAPLRWLDTPQSWAWMVERWLEIFGAARVVATDRIVFAFSFGPFIGFWLAFEAGAKLGALCLPAGGLSTLGRLRLILESRATVLCCTPSYALHLAETAVAETIDLGQGHVRRIIVAGEPGGSIPSTRARLEALWPKASVFDHHGMTETGPVSLECPARPGVLHVMESGFIAEIVDPGTGQLLPPGPLGELVLTNLGRTGSPLIRYRTGDLVKPDRTCGPCACGRSDLALIGGILGRVDDMVVVRGVNVFPTAVEDVLRTCGEIAEYQVKVTRVGALTELVVLLEPETGCPDVPALVARVQKRFQETLALRVPVEVATAGSLPRYEMKAKRWIRAGWNP